MKLIKKVKKLRTFNVELRVITFRWNGICSDAYLAGQPCSVCKNKIGDKLKWGLAWVEEEGKEHAERLCNSCGLIAEDVAEKVLESKQKEQQDE